MLEMSVLSGVMTRGNNSHVKDMVDMGWFNTLCLDITSSDDSGKIY